MTPARSNKVANADLDDDDSDDDYSDSNEDDDNFDDEIEINGANGRDRISEEEIDLDGRIESNCYFYSVLSELNLILISKSRLANSP